LAALGAHALLFAYLPRQRAAQTEGGDTNEPFTVEFFEPAPPPAAAANVPAPEALAEPQERSPQAAVARTAPNDHRPPNAERDATAPVAEAPPKAPEGATGAEAGAEGPRGPINFNLGALAGRAFAPVPGPAPPSEAAPGPPVNPAERARTYLQQAQDNHDRELGLGWGGEVTAAAHSGPIRDAAPGGEGEAVIEVELDASGAAVAAHVRSASSQPDGWRRVADALLSALRNRRVRGLDGSRGGRVALRFQARERLPSGSDSVVKQCGLGACGDLADVGAQKLRTLNVRLERKERL
jgi:hypothetical protein